MVGQLFARKRISQIISGRRGGQCHKKRRTVISSRVMCFFHSIDGARWTVKAFIGRPNRIAYAAIHVTGVNNRVRRENSSDFARHRQKPIEESIQWYDGKITLSRQFHPVGRCKRIEYLLLSSPPGFPILLMVYICILMEYLRKIIGWYSICKMIIGVSKEGTDSLKLLIAEAKVLLAIIATTVCISRLWYFV